MDQKASQAQVDSSAAAAAVERTAAVGIVAMGIVVVGNVVVGTGCFDELEPDPAEVLLILTKSAMIVRQTGVGTVGMGAALPQDTENIH